MEDDIILASASPRRFQLLKSILKRSFSVHLATCREKLYPSDPVRSVGSNALAKWRSVHKRYPMACIIASDTLVFSDGRALGKPRNSKEAEEMLMSYAGRTQLVFTAVAINRPGKKRPDLRIEASSVLFKQYDEAVVQEYIDVVQPFDRAGAYDINEHGDWLIEELAGSYSTVMGLPLGVVRDWFSAHLPNALKCRV